MKNNIKLPMQITVYHFIFQILPDNQPMTPAQRTALQVGLKKEIVSGVPALDYIMKTCPCKIQRFLKAVKIGKFQWKIYIFFLLLLTT